jgi:hypothetical protein
VIALHPPILCTGVSARAPDASHVHVVYAAVLYVKTLRIPASHTRSRACVLRVPGPEAVCTVCDRKMGFRMPDIQSEWRNGACSQISDSDTGRTAPWPRRSPRPCPRRLHRSLHVPVLPPLYIARSRACLTRRCQAAGLDHQRSVRFRSRGSGTGQNTYAGGCCDSTLPCFSWNKSRFPSAGAHSPAPPPAVRLPPCAPPPSSLSSRLRTPSPRRASHVRPRPSAHSRRAGADAPQRARRRV